MNKKGARTFIRTAGLVLLLSGIVVAVSSPPVQADNLGPTGIEVTKTCSVPDGLVSCTIIITNTGKNPAEIKSIIDTLEVHFPAGDNPLSLPPGSTLNWFKVASVPGLQTPSNPIPVRGWVSIDIDPHFDTCDADTYTGANSMRNVVLVTLLNGPNGQKTVTTRSDSFVPPSQAGCCGNGVVNAHEQCDNTSGCCSSACQFVTGTCNDHNACTTGDVCSGGACTSGNPVVCSPPETCHTAGTCDPETGACSNPNAADGTSCVLGTGCDDVCVGGVCLPGAT